MKEFVAHILTEFQRGHLSLDQAVDRLLTEKTSTPVREHSDRRLINLCHALRQEQDPAQIERLKAEAMEEFYEGGR